MSIPASAMYSIIQEMPLRDNNLLNIVWLCDVAGVSRSGYYHYLKTEGLRQWREENDRQDFLIRTVRLLQNYLAFLCTLASDPTAHPFSYAEKPSSNLLKALKTLACCIEIWYNKEQLKSVMFKAPRINARIV